MTTSHFTNVHSLAINRQIELCRNDWSKNTWKHNFNTLMKSTLFPASFYIEILLIFPTLLYGLQGFYRDRQEFALPSSDLMFFSFAFFLKRGLKQLYLKGSLLHLSNWPKNRKWKVHGRVHRGGGDQSQLNLSWLFYLMEVQVKCQRTHNQVL